MSMKKCNTGENEECRWQFQSGILHGTNKIDHYLQFSPRKISSTIGNINNKSILSIVNTIQLSDRKFVQCEDKSIKNYKSLLQGFWYHWTQTCMEDHKNCQPTICLSLKYTSNAYIPIFDLNKLRKDAFNTVEVILYQTFIISDNRLEQLIFTWSTNSNEAYHGRPLSCQAVG